jgi:hypothetical protein
MRLEESSRKQVTQAEPKTSVTNSAQRLISSLNTLTRSQANYGQHIDRCAFLCKLLRIMPKIGSKNFLEEETTVDLKLTSL